MGEVEPSLDNVTVGSRFYSDGYFGTVMYIGEVPPTKGVWLGVDWDDATRGKHDGSHEGRRYFTATHPTSGSFLRPKKADFGISMYAALSERYGIVEDEHAGVILEEMYVQGKGKQTVVEVVGARKVNIQQSQFDQLKSLLLKDMKISGAGPESALENTCPNVEELDISQNLIPSWEEVAKIAVQLKKLEILNLSENQLRFPDNPPGLCSAFLCLKTIILNRMQLCWRQVLDFSKMWPDIQEILVCYNNISTISELPPPQLHNLTLIDLEGNQLDDWSSVLQLGTLKRVETLHLNKTGLVNIFFNDVQPGETTHYFPALKCLSLNDNGIHEWSSFNELNKLSVLEDILIKRNPIMETGTVEQVRENIVARMKGLKMCNRTVVEEGERRGAEIDYLKIHGQEWRQAGGHQDPEKNKPHQEFLCKHPRYQEFVAKYGPPEDSEMQKQNMGALKHDLLSVEIKNPNFPEKPSIKKRLPRTMKIQKLKPLIQRLYKIGDLDFKLVYTSQKAQGTEYDFDDDLKELSYFSIEDGDTILVKS
ncbi:tubulin-specific chaperone E-like [Lingula anatina]|uniref:Tubulin-specific chaperone E n=1 Tax=Lingula anatina TaxID=7574 RepID=A0A1S3IDI9_LINAN|nr:tubulin-specific chaperone E-like [Lingula anatina]|eukprot:XP_013395926.1 tubulin-specific chaperone E-like [Lingula anatina]